MIYLLLAILASSLVSIVMRLTKTRVKNETSLLAVNYLTCITIAGCYMGFQNAWPQGEGSAWAVGLGALTGALCARFSWLRELLAPLLTAVRSVPVASFVIVALIWVPSKRLSVLISFLIAFPLIHTAVLDGLTHIDPKLLEMAKVFRMPRISRLTAIELPAVLPRLSSAAGVAMGLAWKSGVAAEVIGIPTGSIGERLYKAKVYLATPDLFAWTLTIVLVSMLCERALKLIMKRAARALERM